MTGSDPTIFKPAEHRGRVFRVPVIMMYHSVCDDARGRVYGTTIAPARFERQIASLTDFYRVVGLEEFVAALGSRSRSEGMAAITFDDGFFDNLTVARGILEKYRAPATVFVTSGFVGRPYFWWDGFSAAGAAAAQQPERTKSLLREILSDFDPDQTDWFRAAWDRLRRYPLGEAYAIVDRLASSLGASLDGLSRPVGLQELRGLAEWPLTVGSHALSHRPLPSLPLSEAQREMSESRSWLEAHTGRPVRAFSYPFGAADRDVIARCPASGYDCAVSISTDYHLSYTNAFDLPRVDAGEIDADDPIPWLGRFEEKNINAYATRRMGGPSPLELTASRRQIYLRPQSSGKKSAQLSSADFFRTTPVNRLWGQEQGKALDRPFIEKFMATHAGDVYGRILEIKSPEYAQKYARPDGEIDILDIDSENRDATIIDDLQEASKIADESYDCIILTQVLQFIPNVERAVATVARILRPGGVLLLSAPGITQTVDSRDGAFLWSFFGPGLKLLLSRQFDAKKLVLEAHGNAGLAASFLMGLPVEAVPSDLFAVHDPEYPIVLTARAVKPLPVPEELSWMPACETPEVSIIIPMFNAAGTIKETLFSVTRQRHDSWEVIIVDDGSSDNSRAVVERIAEASRGRVTIIEHAGNENRGLALSRDLGMARARGEFLVFLDADDTIHPDKLRHDVDILRRHSRAAAVVGRTLWWWDGAGERDADIDMIFEPVDRLVEPPVFFEITFRESGGVSPCVHSWMVRKSCLDTIDFDVEVMTYEDQKFLGELSLRFPIYVSGSCLCEYRRKEHTLWADAVSSGTDPIARARFREWKSAALKASPAFPRQPRDQEENDL